MSETQILDGLGTRVGSAKRLDQQLAQIEHLDSATAQRSANPSCSSCARSTHGSPSKSSASLLRGVNRFSSLPGAVQQHRPQPADLGPDPRCRHCLNGHECEITDCQNPPGEARCRTSLGW